MKIVETDNFGGDYLDEKFAMGGLTRDQAEHICKAINEVCSGPNSPRYWIVVGDDYELQPGVGP